MAVTDYTTSASVRAVLGVAEEELEDTTIESTVFGTRLDETFYGMNASLPDDFLTIGALGAPSTLQIRFLNLVEAFAAYQVAGFLLGSVALFAPQEIEASRDRFARVADPYKDLRSDVSNTLAMLTRQLLAVYAQLDPGTPVEDAVDVTYVDTVDLGVDPVTGV